TTTYTMSTTFDVGGRALTTTYPDADAVGPLAYDGAGRLTAVPGIMTSASYDAAGRMTTWTHDNRSGGSAQTFGKTTVGASSQGSAAANNKRVSKYTLSGSGTATSMAMYLKGGTASQPVRLVLYADNAGAPGNLVAVTGETTIAAG